MANSKWSKHSNGGVASVDRISALPESLIYHILSLLPTNNAVQTSVLSKRWKHLWTSITSLYFDDGSSQLWHFGIQEGENKRFVQFVYKVLVLLKTQCLQKFQLQCAQVRDAFHVDTWACAALSRDVRELILDVYLPESFEFPTILFTTKTLSFLSLDCDTVLNVPNSVCLPNLKYIYLSSVKFANDESVLKLLSGCPRLEDLTVQRVDLDNVFNFNISSLTLKSIDLNFVYDIEPDSPRHTLQIDAPVLQYLSLNDCVSDAFVIGNLSSLVKADISVYVSERNNAENGYGDQVLKLLNGLSNVKFLSLSGATMKALSFARERIAPAFHNLTRLQGLFRSSQHESWCIQPEHVPKYLLSRLTTIEIRHFDGSTDELKMVKFILKGAKALKRMTIITGALESEAKLNLVRTITMFPRESKLCEIVVRHEI